MIILKKQIEPQKIKVIAREKQADRIVLRNETTNEEVTILTKFYCSDYYITTSTIFDLVENTFYNLTIFNGSKIVYKDKIFCTNQTIKDFTVNENTYVENDTTNEFIIYE